MTEIYRVAEVWQLADVYFIRRQTKIHGIPVTLAGEFDEKFNHHYHYILLKEGEDPVSTLRVNFENEDFAKIERVSTLEKFQNKGYGRALIQAAESWISERGYHKIIITSLDTAVGFYQKLGYVPDYDIHYSGEVPIIHLEKNIY
ncbi:GNAT family N-acetyltransferase [Agrilactobacillus yilanensis]|uniref:GNAT family N-acetyltransferase n=1 Tax=Agrilactobacillus yilanensis TaxID=2485997 RepID=A0ABW4J506_9LACO|nr:GNAT family N-acetyltransferase [Agrilactobacillus yilanensis]